LVAIKMLKLKPQRKKSHPAQPFDSGRGFSLVECVIALLILMLSSLAVISVLNYAFQSSESARKRIAALWLAEQYLGEVRNTAFNNLPAGTATYDNVISDGIPFKVVRKIEDADILTVDEAFGPEEKSITISVAPRSSSNIGESVTLTTVRANHRPGPNREPNNPD
jgi:type II secretory pathway pseudopilin PulG